MRVVLQILIGVVVVGCAARAPSPSASVSASASSFQASDPAPGIDDRDAIAAAERSTSIQGPWRFTEIRQGLYRDLWRGSSNDMSGAAQRFFAARSGLIVWRVDLEGPHGFEELYIDVSTGALVDSITQGS